MAKVYELLEYIRELCEKKYSNKFSRFFIDFTKYLNENSLCKTIEGSSIDTKKAILDEFIISTYRHYQPGEVLNDKTEGCMENI